MIELLTQVIHQQKEKIPSTQKEKEDLIKDLVFFGGTFLTCFLPLMVNRPTTVRLVTSSSPEEHFVEMPRSSNDTLYNSRQDVRRHSEDAPSVSVCLDWRKYGVVRVMTSGSRL